MIFIDFYAVIKQRLLAEKTNEILKRIKKQPRGSAENYLRSPMGLENSLKIKNVELAKDGTIRTYAEGKKEPFRMYPEIKSVWFTAYYKRFITLILQSLSEMGLVKKIITLLAIKFNFHILSKWFEHIFFIYESTRKDENYSQPVKEFRRVLKGRLDQNLIDALALILEYDSAYRYRFQDIVMELNKDNKPVEEIIRLLDILNKRECGDDLNTRKNSKWGQMRRLVKLGFFFCPKIKKQMIAILRDINIDEIKFSKEDIYWIAEDGYPFQGMTKEERKAENKKVYGE